MFICWFAVTVYALVKKLYRFLPACIAVCIYCAFNFARSMPVLAGTVLQRVLSVLNIPLLLLMLAATVWVCRKPFENGKRYLLPVWLCGSACAAKIFRSVYYSRQILWLQEPGGDAAALHEHLVSVLSVIDLFYGVLLMGMLVSLVMFFPRRKRARAS